MTNKELADLIFPNVDKTIEDYEKIYKNRELKEGTMVTRFAPSPTGFVHIGNTLQALTDYLLSRNSGGIFFLRNEDTDTKREVNEAMDKIMDTLDYLGFTPDEYQYKEDIVGEYGPYIQSKRKEIYHAFIKHLIEIDRAYPCFCTSEELDEMRKKQEAKKLQPGYYGAWAKCRDLTNEEKAERIKNGDAFVIRFKSMGNPNRKIEYHDLVTGIIEFPENNNDMVIMKSGDLLPTYHFAHVVDDHLMKTTHVIRGQEWLPSVPLHLEMFNAFGFEPPKYIHNSLLLKQDGNSRRKISKRKDPEALMDYYIEKGYPSVSVIESLMTILNSNYEEWRDANPDKSYLEFEFNPSKVGTTGALYDLEKLDNISKNIISKMTKDQVYELLVKYTEKYDKDFYDIITKDENYTKEILNIEREQEKPRKDFACMSDVKNSIWYMFDELYSPENYEWMKITDIDEIKNIANTYLNEYYNQDDDKDTWFNKVKELTDSLGYCSNMKEYKVNPDAYKGNVADISTVLRVALTSKSQTPDLYCIMKLLGKERMEMRINNL
ncbi:MAG: glutamate--tRNA ligase [Erysipelotrichales bacterium]|nr:glutamate--tRNA ligase [Erysipelotrichales bacterium]